MKQYIPCLTIAGSDSSGGAGIEADLKTFAALGTYGTAAITAVTAQNTVGVRLSHAMPPEVVAAQIEAVLDDVRPRHIKIGMTANAAVIRAIAGVLRRYETDFVVLDPVMVSTSGHKLIEDEAVEALMLELLPLASLVTPNLPECAVLTGGEMPSTVEEAKTAGALLIERGCRAVLVKGGHLENSPEAVDVLVTPHSCDTFTMPRVATNNTHGTGCTLSSAITAYAARGLDTAAAVRAAKGYLHEALVAGADVKVGEGHGPVNHFFKPEKQIFK